MRVWGRSPGTRPSRYRADHASNEARVLDEAFSLSEPICLLTSELQAAHCEPALLEELLGFATKAVGRGRRRPGLVRRLWEIAQGQSAQRGRLAPALSAGAVWGLSAGRAGG